MKSEIISSGPIPLLQLTIEEIPYTFTPHQAQRLAAAMRKEITSDLAFIARIEAFASTPHEPHALTQTQ